MAQASSTHELSHPLNIQILCNEGKLPSNEVVQVFNSPIRLTRSKHLNSAVQSFGAEVPAYQGHLEWFKFYKEIGYCFDYTIAASALDGGHIDVIQYLLTQTDCPISAELITKSAVIDGNVQILEWLQQTKLLDLTAFHETITEKNHKAIKWGIDSAIF